CGMSRLRLDETAYTSLGGNSNRTWAQRAQSDWARRRRFAGWPQGPVSYIAIRRALQPVEPAAVVGEDLALLGLGDVAAFADLVDGARVAVVPVGEVRRVDDLVLAHQLQGLGQQPLVGLAGEVDVSAPRILARL